MIKVKIFKCDKTQVFNKKGLEIFKNNWYWVSIKSKRISKPFSSKVEAYSDACKCGYTVIYKHKVTVKYGTDVKYKFDIHGNKIQYNKWYYEFKEPEFLYMQFASNTYDSRDCAEQVAISNGYEVINPIKNKRIEVIIIQGRDSYKSHDINCDAVHREKWYYDIVDKRIVRMCSERFDTRERAIEVAIYRGFSIANVKEKPVETKPVETNPVEIEQTPIAYNFDNNTTGCTTIWTMNS